MYTLSFQGLLISFDVFFYWPNIALDWAELNHAILSHLCSTRRSCSQWNWSRELSLQQSSTSVDFVFCSSSTIKQSSGYFHFPGDHTSCTSSHCVIGIFGTRRRGGRGSIQEIEEELVETDANTTQEYLRWWRVFRGEKSSRRLSGLVTSSETLPWSRELLQAWLMASVVGVNTALIRRYSPVPWWKHVDRWSTINWSIWIRWPWKNFFPKVINNYSKTSNASSVRDLYFALLHLTQASLTGSSTACMVALHKEKSILHTANLGDSGFVVIRRNAIVHRSQEQQHYFNSPFQIAIHPNIRDSRLISDR